MIRQEEAKEIAQKLAEGFTLISVRETEKAWLFEFKYYSGKEGADGTDVMVEKETGKASHFSMCTEEGYELFRKSIPVLESE